MSNVDVLRGKEASFPCQCINCGRMFGSHDVEPLTDGPTEKAEKVLGFTPVGDCSYCGGDIVLREEDENEFREQSAKMEDKSEKEST